MNIKRGIITIAFGEKYIHLAKNLSRSLSYYNPQLITSVVTDSAGESQLKPWFDTLIPIKKGLSSNLFHKLLLVDYSPFDETLFIDADCLVYNDLNPVFEVLRKQSFSNVGEEINNGEWYMEVEAVLTRFNLTSIPKINGGIYYFKKDLTSQNVQAKALELSREYNAIGLKPFGDGGLNEEPLYSLSMALNDLTVIPDPNKITMYTPLGISGSFNLNICKSKAEFRKHGVLVKPSIVHFCGTLSSKFHYRREAFCLKLLVTGYPPIMIRLLRQLLFNMPYCIFVFLKRLLKVLSGRKHISFTPLLPVYSNH